VFVYFRMRQEMDERLGRSVARLNQAKQPVVTMSALAYYDTYWSVQLPANLIMAQRDYFGAHRYERIDAEGIFHTEWES
jgi:6-phosphogluconate dehydrogenase